MVKTLLALVMAVMILALPELAMGANGTENYDWLGTAVPRGALYSGGAVPSSGTVPDWLSLSGISSAIPGLYGPSYSRGVYPGYSFMQIEPADPMLERLVVEGNLQTQNQLYIQSGGALTTGGAAVLGQYYTLWAKVANWGAFALYDQNSLILSSNYLAPGWYKISGGYLDLMGSHLFRFTSAGIQSNSLSLTVSPGNYLTSFALIGRVVDQNGNGISGARVLISSSEGGTFTTTTNALGFYGMDVPSGVYLVTAQFPGYSFTQSQARIWLGIASAARDIIGYPISGAQATAQAQTIGTATGAQGYVQPAGTQFVGVVGTPYGGSGVLEGRVVDPLGGGIAGAAISVDGLNSGVTTDDQGRFSLSLSPGQHRIEALQSGWGIPPRVALVEQGQTSSLVLIGRSTAEIGSVKSLS
jgi:hypothetical protein